jgi:hypothetical protein
VVGAGYVEVYLRRAEEGNGLIERGLEFDALAAFRVIRVRGLGVDRGR